MPEAPKKKKTPHAGHRDRVKTEYLTRRLAGWPEHRVLELLLFYAIPQGDVNPLAHALIDRFGSLAGVLDASVDELKKVPGVGEHTAILLNLVRDINGIYQQQRGDWGRIISGPREAGSLLAPYFYGARNEMVYILCMDAKRKFKGVRKISEGDIYNAGVNIRRVAEEALGMQAASIYLAHNHVSNVALPSSADWQLTDVLRTALAPLNVEVVDHLIFVDGDMVSLNEEERSAGRRRAFQMIK